MNASLRVERILGDRPFAEIGEPVLAVMADDRLAVAGEFVHESRRAPLAVYDTGDLSCLAVARSRHPVHAMAFHPTLPLLAAGTGRYDGGYFFEGELLLLDLRTSAVVSLFEHPLGRQVLGLQWLDDHRLRLLLAPPDDWQDRAAWVEGQVAVVRRDDWSAVAPASLEPTELAGPRVPMPRPDDRVPASAAVRRLSPHAEPRRTVRAVEELSDGRILAALADVTVECWLASSEVQWRVSDDNGQDSGGQDLVVSADRRSVWVGLVRPGWQNAPQSLIRYSLTDGAQLDEMSPQHPYALVQCADGQPAVAPLGTVPQATRLRVRRGRRIYVREVERLGTSLLARASEWLSAADPVPATIDGRPREAGQARRLFPYSWVPGESHFAGPGVELADGSLVYAGTVYDGRGLQPGGAFVVRRDLATGNPLWTSHTDHAAVDLDTDTDTAYVAYQDGEIVALDLQNGAVRQRWRLPRVFPTALTVTGPDRLLVGTSDGRILDCRTMPS
ncbi:hypothetical protein GCM10010172_39430 [Paractinoplanes ferrugineus]|uniref:Uncharacterized protein n=1 Tax=Paractinoplanes ferrugineus TaxID=113564 RepID=A0A919MHK1_9ACTN|nr:hypothetical protein [Actinoplanes ferrugineus]GIE12720.1 hypothetical protein Afe05nite_45600 [Actinoplanes ferrugineus]